MTSHSFLMLKPWNTAIRARLACATCVQMSMQTSTTLSTGDLTSSIIWKVHGMKSMIISTKVIGLSLIWPGLSAHVATTSQVQEPAPYVQLAAQQRAQLSATISTFRVKASAYSFGTSFRMSKQEIYKASDQYYGSISSPWCKTIILKVRPLVGRPKNSWLPN